MTFAKLFGATTLATMLAFNVSYTAAQFLKMDGAKGEAELAPSGPGGQAPGPKVEPQITGKQPAPVPAAIAIPNLLDARKSGNESSGLPTDKPAEFKPGAQTGDVDKAMGILPSPGAGKPGGDAAAKGIIVINGKPMSYEEAKKMGVDPSGAESKGIIIVNNKPVSLSDAAAKGIVIVNNKPGGLPSPGASKGIIITGGKPGGDAAAKGIVITNNKPGGDAATKGLSPITSAPGMLPAGKGPPTVLPAGKGPPTVLPAGTGPPTVLPAGKGPPTVLPAGTGMMTRGK